MNKVDVMKIKEIKIQHVLVECEQKSFLYNYTYLSNMKSNKAQIPKNLLLFGL